VLAPEGDEDSDTALGGAREACRVGEGETAAGNPGDEGDEQVVEAADEDPDDEGFE
jgi:hypothetical protein